MLLVGLSPKPIFYQTPGGKITREYKKDFGVESWGEKSNETGFDLSR